MLKCIKKIVCNYLIKYTKGKYNKFKQIKSSSMNDDDDRIKENIKSHRYTYLASLDNTSLHYNST